MFSLLHSLVLIILALLAFPFLIALAFILFLFDSACFLTRLTVRREQNKASIDTDEGSVSGRKSGQWLPQRERILIVQSAEPAYVFKALDRLKSMPLFQNSRYTIFCRDHAEIVKHFVGHPMFHQVLTHSETQGWWKHIVKLRRERFYAVVVFFTGDPSYWKIKYFSFLLSARRKLIFDENSNCYFLSLAAWLALLERDLILSGIFQSSRWKMSRALRWLAEQYRSLCMRRASSIKHKAPKQTLSVESMPIRENEMQAHPSEAALFDPLSSLPGEDRRSGLINAKQVLTSLSEISLHGFLSSRIRFCLPVSPDPEVSVILVLYNRAELTFQCLRSLAENGYESLEVIVVDNASSDATPLLLNQLDGVTILRNNANIHFLLAANKGARQARGRYILFLNNDAQVLPGSIEAAVKSIESSRDIGAVGGKIILPDGLLQEAGSIIWRDGSCFGYGRGGNPFAPYYMFRRDVDYCSGAFLLTRRDTFLNMGGFDEAYKPCYYEETDFCLRLWERNLRVVYEPDATILHYEFASSSSPGVAKEIQARNQSYFFDCHRDRLQHQYDPNEKNLLKARNAVKHRHRVLFIDDRVPHPSMGSGLPRSNAILLALAKYGCFITFYPTAVIDEEWRDIYVDIPREVEVIIGYGSTGLEQFLSSRAEYYDLILVSRPHNMQFIRPIIQAHPDWFRNTKLVYDAEALYSFRDIACRQLKGESFSDRNIEQLIKSEVELATIADLVVSVSVFERDAFAKYGIERVRVLGHALTVSPTPRIFQDRNGFLFVGAIQGETSPNGDAILWFTKQILPIIRNKLSRVPFTIVGMSPIDISATLTDDQLRILGRIDDLTSTYDEARIFVAPTRFAAGIPHKIHEAAAHGVPVIATSLLARQLGWQDGEHLLVADEPQAFADQCVRLYNDIQLWEKIRVNALNQVRLECSPQSFEDTLRLILEED